VRFFIIFYMLLVFIVSLSSAQNQWLAVEGVNVTDVSGVGAAIQGQAASLEAAKPKEFTSVVKSQLMTFIDTIKVMATFSFSINGAPEVVNQLLSIFFGLMSIMFFLALLREVKNLVPWA